MFGYLSDECNLTTFRQHNDSTMAAFRHGVPCVSWLKRKLLVAMLSRVAHRRNGLQEVSHFIICDCLVLNDSPTLTLNVRNKLAWLRVAIAVGFVLLGISELRRVGSRLK